MELPEPAARAEALEKFLLAHPESPQADPARAEMTRSLAAVGESQLADKNIDAAILTFRKAIASFPKVVDDKFFEETAARIPLAVSVRGYRTEAILLAREMEARFSSEANRLAALGEFYMSVEAPAEAVRALSAAVKTGSSDARIFRTLGTAYRLNLNLEKAGFYQQQAIKVDPQDRRAYFELGNLQRAAGKAEAALNLYNQQLVIDPQHAGSLKGLALIHISQGRDKEAGEALAKVATLPGNDLSQDFFFQTQLSLAYLSRGNLSNARKAADAALAAEPRYSWARIAAAEVDLAENKYFDAERNLLAALRFADFPTIHFVLGQTYIAAEDFDGAIEQLNKAYSYRSGKFQTMLGGFVEAKADTVSELLAPEREATIFQPEAPASEVDFKLAENLTKFDEATRAAKQNSSGTVSAMVLGQSVNKLAFASLEKAAAAFADSEASRRPFRWLYIAERLILSGQLLDSALKYSDLALEVAETATAAEGSLRDFPNYDREGRLRVFKGRALTLRGRSLLKLGRKQEAIAVLSEAVESFGPLPERRNAQWQLAMAKESAGQSEDALALYMEAYEPPAKGSFGSDLNRAIIESLYRRIHGSLSGLDERIGRPRETAVVTAAPVTTPVPAGEPQSTPTVTQPVAADPLATLPAATPAPPPAQTPAAVTEAPKALAEVIAPPVTLPETRLIGLILDLPAGDGNLPELALAAEEDPAPVTVPALRAETVADAVAVLPEARVIPLLLDMNFALVPEVVADITAAAEDAPPVMTVLAPDIQEKPKPSRTALSDSRVAEIERSIEASVAAPGGKKGDRSAAAEESAIGHIEGDRPVRTNPRPAIEFLPSGESGHTESERTKELPQDVEKKASDMGKTAGKLSTDAAMELDSPDKATGKKGTKESPSRPRRVGEKP